MIRFKFLLFLFPSLGIGGNSIPLKVVKFVDLDRYLGKWYEIARFDQKFQKGCTATEANYSKRSDGDLKVVNSCRLGSPLGKIKESTARAWVIDKNSNAKLKVQFFLSSFKMSFLAGNYWILDLDENYQHVIVGDESRKYLWILNRNKKMEKELYLELVDKAKNMGFEVNKLIKTIH